jgi:hypothetical protein
VREAIASPNRELEDRPAKVGPKIVPIDQDADVMLQFEVEPKRAEGAGILQSEQKEEKEKKEAETLRVAVFPTESHAAPPAVIKPAVQAVATALPLLRNWRKAILPLLAIVVLTQAALMAYWLMSSGGVAAVTTTTGNVTITSEPSGSAVAIDGAVRGQTPLTIALSSGSHAVVVGTGVQSRSQNVNVTRGADSSMHVQLPAAVAAPAAVAKGKLQIATEPPGARVWVDGEARGTAPITISSLDGGDHAVTVRSGSGDAIKRTVTVQEGATASLVITMPGAGAFASGWLAISSAVPLQVMEKGELLGTTESPRILLPTGAHELELVNAGLNYRVTRNVTIAGGQTASFTLIPPRGTLSVNALPWAEVWIDGQRAGETPIGNYSLPIGTHELLFRHPELGEQRKTVTVGAQGPVRVGVDMKKP